MNSPQKVKISVTILAKNEEVLIERCIKSVVWADEILVLDSGSIDNTRIIAAQCGATVHEQAWLGWVPQRQAAIRLAKHNWILVVEADEIVTPALAKGIIQVMRNNPDERDGYTVDRRDELFGKLMPNMKRKSLQHNFIRLFNRNFSRYNEDEVIHETVICPGKRIALPGLLLHWRNVTFLQAMLQDLKNMELEAKLMQASKIDVGAVRLLVMPLARFVWCYFFKGGYRLGTVGIIYALIRAHAEFLRHVRVWELQHPTQSPHPPLGIWNPKDMPVQ